MVPRSGNEISGLPVQAFLHGNLDSATSCLVLTHGAGSNCHSPLLLMIAVAFAEVGVAVVRCNLMFRQQRPQGPPPRGSAERDQAGLRAVVTALQRQTPAPVYLGGHSYGGRQASILAANEPSLVDRLLLLSYPLHPPQRPDQLRTEHFPRLATPSLFVQGTRDGFASIAEMTAALALIPAPAKLMQVSDAGHELLKKHNGPEQARKIAESFRTLTDPPY